MTGNLSRNFDKLWIGLIVGLIGPWIGFLIFWLVTSSHLPIANFARFIYKNPDALSAMISVGLVANLPFFFIALRRDYYQTVQGVIMASFVYAPFIVYFKYVA